MPNAAWATGNITANAAKRRPTSLYSPTAGRNTAEIQQKEAQNPLKQVNKEWLNLCHALGPRKQADQQAAE